MKVHLLTSFFYRVRGEGFLERLGAGELLPGDMSLDKQWPEPGQLNGEIVSTP